MNRHLPFALLIAGVSFAATPPTHATPSNTGVSNRGFADVVAKDLLGVVRIYTTRVENTSADVFGLGQVPGGRRCKQTATDFPALRDALKTASGMMVLLEVFRAGSNTFIALPGS